MWRLMDLALGEDMKPRMRIAGISGGRQMRILSVRRVGSRKVGERVDADILYAPALSFWLSAVGVNRERFVGQQSNCLGHGRLRKATEGRVHKSMGR